MSINKSISIAIFGLNLRSLNDLKEQVKKAVPANTDITWTNVAEPNLKVLFINHHFYDTPSIENLIKTNHIHVLKLMNNHEKGGSIENNTLYLPIHSTHDLQQWLIEEVLKRSTEVTMQSATLLKHAHDNSDKNKFLEELLNPLNGKIQVFDSAGQLGLADARAQRFWASPDRVKQNTDATLNFTYATMSDSIKLAKVPHQDLKFWLWNLLWKSPDFGTLAAEDCCIQLRYWPQPDDGFDRKDILRMSACFIQGAQTRVVAEHLDIPLQRVRHFVSASLGSDMGILISSGKAKFQPKQQQNQEEVGAVRRFFGSLRRRLGL